MGGRAYGIRYFVFLLYSIYLIDNCHKDHVDSSVMSLIEIAPVGPIMSTSGSCRCDGTRSNKVLCIAN